MKIEIRDSEGQKTLHLPTGMLMNKTVLGLVCRNRSIQSRLRDLPPEAVEAIVAELNEVRKKHGSWELLEVDTPKGENIRIIL